MNPTDIPLELFEIQAQFARALGNATRLRILHILDREGGEVAVAQLLRELGIPSTSLSQHLSKMREVGLLNGRKEGRFRYVSLASPEIGQACELVREAVARRVRDRHSLLEAQGGQGGAS